MDIDDANARELEPPASSNHDWGREVSDMARIKLSSRGGGTLRDGQRMEIGGFDTEELDAMEGMLYGHNWVTVSHLGRLRIVPTYKKLPGPTDDEMMLPFWRHALPEVEAQMELFPMEPLPDFSSPSILIQHLCGYGFTQENYRHEAKKLMGWGFDCLRSRRSLSGQYWEIWFLPSLWSAQGDLKAAIESAPKKGSDLSKSGKQSLDAAISFLCRNSSFGTLDACNQRAAMTLE